MENTDNEEIRQLLKKAIERLAIIDVPSECFVRQALALLPCETCGGTGKKPRPEGQQHCRLLLCQDLTCSCSECDFYIPQEPCPDCQP